MRGPSFVLLDGALGRGASAGVGLDAVGDMFQRQSRRRLTVHSDEARFLLHDATYAVVTTLTACSPSYQYGIEMDAESPPYSRLTRGSRLAMPR